MMTLPIQEAVPYIPSGVIRVGIAVYLVRDGKILMLKRKDGKWGIVGGKMEFGETQLLTARRELLEETGITCSKFSFHGMSNTILDEDGIPTHWLTLYYKAEDWLGVPILMEPDKHDELKWVDPKEGWPEPMFEPLKSYLTT